MLSSDFDIWRDKYDSMDVASMRSFYDMLHSDHPEQSHFDLRAVCSWLRSLPSNPSILELGGYDGELAEKCIGQYGSWVNLEISSVDSRSGLDHRYVKQTLHSFPWECELPKCDGFIASHSLEHLSDDHAYLMLSRIDCDNVYIDMPLGNPTGTTAAHKMVRGWDTVVSALHGFRCYSQLVNQKENSEIRMYRR